jgi:hypothetical protein
VRRFCSCKIGRTLATTYPDRKRGESVLSLWETETGKLRRRFSLPLMRDAENIQFAPDGRTLLIVQRCPVIHLWDTVTGKRRIHDARVWIESQLTAKPV